MKAHKYPLTYDLRAEDPPLTRAELEAAGVVLSPLGVATGRGACDAAILLSLTYPEDGSFAMLLVSKDGRTGDVLPDAEIFKCWALLAKRLAESRTLHPAKRELARTLWEVWTGGHAKKKKI